MILGLTTHANSQSQKFFHFGIKGGVNLAGVSDYRDNTRLTRFGAMIGVSAEFSRIGFPLGLESGIYYAQKGKREHMFFMCEASADISCPDGDMYEIFQLDYIEIPLLAKLYLKDSLPVRPYFFGGGYMSFTVRSNEVDTIGGRKESTQDISEEVENREFGWLAGIGTDLSLGRRTANVQLRYSHSLTDTFRYWNGQNELVSLVFGIRF